MNATAGPREAANRLAAEPSPYLRQHAHNPVDWYPWGAEALARAKAEDKPILLSVGYSACHWCHVMAHESFEDPATAALMNRHFVNVKVDREERPDVDQLYQGVVQLMGRGGGWPLTVFLTPDLRPFYGGTYFPPEPRHGLPGFPRLLEALSDAWREERSELDQQGDVFKSGLTKLAGLGLEAERSSFRASDVVDTARLLDRHLDRVNGGFGQRGPKFPNPMNLALILRGYRRAKDPALLEGTLFTLERMAKGGVYDQLGGGFHRYSVDERWLVPHFEKMLYDNAQLIHLYAEAMQIAPRPLWRKVVEETVGWLEREMTSPDGGFYAAQDADSDGEEGRYFVWRTQELEVVLGSAAALAKAHFGVTLAGNFEHGASVLEVVRDEEQLGAELELSPDEVRARLAAAKRKLLDERATRVAPGRDDKLLAGWNGLAIRGLAHASRVFARDDWARLAARAADLMLAKLRRPDGGLWRSLQAGAPRVDGLLEDYGGLCAGLAALYQVTFDARYLEAAEQLADAAWARFWDPDRQAWLTAPKGTADLLVPCVALHDNALPSGASSLTEALIALAALTGRRHHLDRATAWLERLRTTMLENPLGFGHLFLAADALVDGASELTVVGPPGRTAEFLQVLANRFEPTIAVQCVDPAAPISPVSAEVLAGRTSTADVSAFLCSHFSCRPPVHDPAGLGALLDASR